MTDVKFDYVIQQYLQPFNCEKIQLTALAILCMETYDGHKNRILHVR